MEKLIMLEEADWLPRAATHRARVEPVLVAHLDRRRRGQKHPVHDFLFEYYSYGPAKLSRWHPGAGRALTGKAAEPYRRLGAYRDYPEGVAADLDRLPRRQGGLQWTLDLLARIAARPARLDCLGLHEWAMVYRTRPGDVRHENWPLRLGHDGTDEVVRSHQLRCSHIDAFRFFTKDARPLNPIQLTRESQPDHDQPGCLHANMDCYRWATKIAPYGDSELLLDCFELALQIRELDMQASPYDLTDLGYEPVRIETIDGKAEYVRRQRELGLATAALRDRLINDYRRVLALTPSSARASRPVG